MPSHQELCKMALMKREGHVFFSPHRATHKYGLLKTFAFSMLQHSFFLTVKSV